VSLQIHIAPLDNSWNACTVIRLERLRQCDHFAKDTEKKKTTRFNRPEQSIHHIRVVHLLPMILAHGNIFYFLALLVGRFGHQPTRLLFHLFLGGRQHNIKILPSSDNRILIVFQPMQHMAVGRVTLFT
jgi:hypothetical protein